jgi:hypothetical protein
MNPYSIINQNIFSNSDARFCQGILWALAHQCDTKVPGYQGYILQKKILLKYNIIRFADFKIPETQISCPE